MPLVSVIMPAYNAAAFVEAAIDSVLAQTLADFELIVVDDGSSDGTADIAAAAAARDPRVVFVRQANGGVSKARNAALRLSSGRFIALLDSDDIWEPEFLRMQLAVLDRRPDASLVSTNALMLGGPRDGQPVQPYPDTRPEPTLDQIIGDETASFIMCVFRRAVYEAIGGFDESKTTNEDYDYWIRATHAGFRFCRNDVPLARYRWRADSLSANETRMLRGILVVLKEHRALRVRGAEQTAVLEAQIQRFETELVASQARTALETGDYGSVARHLAALEALRPGLAVTLARAMARVTPRLLAWLYRARRAHMARAAH
jgi:Glycosyl transferase family 2